MDTDPQDPPQRRNHVTYFTLPLALYIAIVTPLALSNADRINPDAVAYIRRGMYVANGDFYHSLTGYWSPLISWCIAPLIKLGMDGLYAARLVTFIWGGIWMLAAATFLHRFTTIHWLWKMLGLLVLAPFIAQVASRQISPDVMLAACLLFYFSIVLSPNLLRRPSLQFAAGLLGGFSYLVKAYALPFILIHLPATIFVRRFLEPRDQPLPPRPILGPLATSILGVAICALPWIAANTWRFGRLTISTAGKHTHTDIGPREVQAKIPEFFGRVEDPYISRHETKESIDYPTWSPFQSRKYFKHQLRVAASHSLAIVRSIGLFDRFYLSAIATIIALVAILGLLPIDFPRWRLLWLLLTAAIFCSGMLFVFFTARHLVTLWAPLALALCLTVALKIGPPQSQPFTPLRSIAASAVLISFLAAAIFSARHTDDNVPNYRVIAAALRDHNIRGPLASPDRQQLLFVSYFAGEKALGFPPDSERTVAEQKLLEAQPAALLIFKGKKIPKDMQLPTQLANEIAASPNWQLAFELPLTDKQTLEVYAPRK